jgi:uncharacterized membrane protein
VGKSYTSATSAGGLPDPSILARYEKLVPGSAANILAAFQAESAHRRKLEEIAQAAQIADTRRGQFFGLLIGLAAIVSGAVTAIYGHEWAGGFIGAGGVGVIGVVGVFVRGRSHR